MASLKGKDLSSGRHYPARDRESLWRKVYLYTGIQLARGAVCDGHTAPFDVFAAWHLDRPALSLLRGPRGGGKSFMTALDVHFESRWNPGLYTRVLAGSRSQAQQIHGGLDEAILKGRGPAGFTDRDQIRTLGKIETRYANGSAIQVLTASERAVRGPHGPRLRVDEVEEVLPDLRESASGMMTERNGIPPKITYTSTHHRLGGEMGKMIARAEEENAAHPGSFPSWSFCIWEVLEHCPEERSGPWVGGDEAYERCPECPIRRWCHEGRDAHAGQPKAKRAGGPGGHYTIDTLILQSKNVSERVLRTDFFVEGPQAVGLWFPHFDPNVSVVEDPNHLAAGQVATNVVDFIPVQRIPWILAIDAGTSKHTGAVLGQAWTDARTNSPHVQIWADYYAVDRTIEENVLGIKAMLRGVGVADHRVASVVLDHSAGNASGLGRAAYGVYKEAFPGDERTHLGRKRDVRDGLELLEVLVRRADGRRCLWVHPRCRALIDAFAGYRRKKVRGEYTEEPEDPQHPFEEMMDSLRYFAWDAFPKGLASLGRPLPTVPAQYLI
jgi:hypothetical protein